MKAVTQGEPSFIIMCNQAVVSNSWVPLPALRCITCTKTTPPFRYCLQLHWFDLQDRLSEDRKSAVSLSADPAEDWWCLRVTPHLIREVFAYRANSNVCKPPVAISVSFTMGFMKYKAWFGTLPSVSQPNFISSVATPSFPGAVSALLSCIVPSFSVSLLNRCWTLYKTRLITFCILLQGKQMQSFSPKFVLNNDVETRKAMAGRL